MAWRRRSALWQGLVRHAESAGQRRVQIALAAVALLAVTMLVVATRPEPGGRTILEPAPSALAGAGSRFGLPPDPPTGPVDVGVEPSAVAGSPGAASGASNPGDDAVASGGDAAGGGQARASTGPAAPAPRPKNAAPPPAVPAPAVSRFSALSGESCPQSANFGYFRKGWHIDWYTRPSGGWTANGCRGDVVAVPMSGYPNRDDLDNVIVWWFSIGAPATCAISVYVPGTGHPLDAAGAPASYFVYGTTNATGPAIAAFTVDQVHNQGRWVKVGSIPQRTGQLSVRMVTRGVDWGPGRYSAHLGVSALQVSC